MQASRPADVDRLPWLEPYSEAKKPGRPLPKSGYGKPIAIGLGAALLIAVGAGGYWLGQRGTETPPTASQTVAIAPVKPAPAPAPAPVPTVTPIKVAEAPPPPPAAEAASSEAPKVVKKSKPTRKATRHRSSRKKIHSAGLQSSNIDSVRAQQERLAKSRPWPKMPSPGPAGQVIQLGAFSTATRANNAYRQRIARYPLLGSMPKVVVPVITKPDGRILYVLRLGTTSRDQSKTVCRNLRASGDHCLVIG